MMSKPSFHVVRVVFASLALAALAPNRAAAYDFIKDSVPNRWIEPLVPEDLPDLKYPSYFNDVDKARAQVQTGRYRRGRGGVGEGGKTRPGEGGVPRGTGRAALARGGPARAAPAAA